MINLWGLLIVEIMLALIFFLLNRQDILAPSVLMTLVFSTSTFIAILNGGNWDIHYSFNAAALISLGLFLFGVTDIFIRKLFGVKKMSYIEATSLTIFVERWKTWLIIFADMIIVLLVYQEVQRIASTGGGYTNAFYAYRIITSHSTQRSADQYMNGLVNQSMKLVIVTGFLFAFVFINNVLICRGCLKRNVSFLIPPVLLCIMTLITGVRTNILRLCVFGLVCWYILLQCQTNWRIKTSWKFIRILVIAAIAILFLFSISQSMLGRKGSTDLWTVISNYAGASIQHFNQYIQDPPDRNTVFGQETFSGVWNLMRRLGLVTHTYSVHGEYRYLNATEFGNVYTFFRRYLQDFNPIGMCIMSILTAGFFSLIYNHSIRCRSLSYRRNIVIIEYAYLYYIIAISSIDNIVHDYLNVGTVLMCMLLHVMYWFMFRLRISAGPRSGRTVG